MNGLELVNMKNKDFLNICYKFFNRFINADTLIVELKTLDRKKLKSKDIEEIDKLINEINEILKNIPNKEDNYIKNKKEKIKKLIEKIENITKDDNNIEFLNKQLSSLKKDYKREIDSYERWYAVTSCIDKNEYFNKNFENLTDYELLEFIAQYIKAPFPPQITQEEFDRLVKVGIENDEREWLWRLAFNYENSNMNFNEIINYYINNKDGYYLAELISTIGECLNIDDIIDKINNKELIEDLKNRKSVISSYVSDEQYNRLINKVDKGECKNE